VIAQQFQPRCGQIRRQPGDADVDVLDVVESGLFRPAVLGAGAYREPEYGAEESRAAAQVAHRDSGVVDAEERAGTVRAAPGRRDASRRECEQFQWVAVVITELERGHTS
jgi:hypothetical protein